MTLSRRISRLEGGRISGDYEWLKNLSDDEFQILKVRVLRTVGRRSYSIGASAWEQERESAVDNIFQGLASRLRFCQSSI
jgi:hypothetical protein